MRERMFHHQPEIKLASYWFSCYQIKTIMEEFHISLHQELMESCILLSLYKLNLKHITNKNGSMF